MRGSNAVVYKVVGGGVLHTSHLDFIDSFGIWQTVYSSIWGECSPLHNARSTL